jgi:hypothetical protein
MARIDPQINLRIPAELKQKIDSAAKDSNRSMNAEVVSRLERTFTPASEFIHIQSNEGITIHFTKDVLGALRLFSKCNKLDISEELTKNLRQIYFGALRAGYSEDQLVRFLEAMIKSDPELQALVEDKE